MSQVSIVIRCYNEQEHIGKLLYGIFKQQMDDFEVILVDSGSTDGTLELAQEFPIDEIVYIPPEKFSFGRALNLGCEAASGEFCVFASAHVYPTRNDWLKILLEKFEKKVALVYGKQRGNEITKFPEKQIFRQWFPDEDIRYQQSPFCNNANAAIRREVWEEFQYDETLTGLEDLDWAKRVQEGAKTHGRSHNHWGHELREIYGQTAYERILPRSLLEQSGKTMKAINLLRDDR